MQNNRVIFVSQYKSNQRGMKYSMLSKMNFNSLLLSFLALFLCADFSHTQLRLTSPNGGEIWRSGGKYNITWINSLGNVTMEYSTNGGTTWSNIGTSNTGTYLWTVPNVKTISARVRIVDQLMSRDTSDGNFRIIITNFPDSTIKILPLGNSITFDQMRAEFRFAQDKISYRLFLWDSLRRYDFNTDFIGHASAGYYQFPDPENNGIPGIRDDQVYNLLQTGYDPLNEIQLTPGNYLNFYSPHIILLHIGTNGITDPGGTDSLDVRNILDLIKAYNPNIWVLVAQIIDRVPNIPEVTIFNNNIKTMVQNRIARGDNLFLLDMRSALNYVIDTTPPYADGDMFDDSHPNDSGKVKMANVWFQTLKWLLPNSTAQVPSFVSTPDTFAYVGLPYKYNANANGVGSPLYSLEGSLPPGMTVNSINSKTGIIDWVPTLTGNFSVKIKAVNSAGSAFQEFTINVIDRPQLIDNVVSYWKLDDSTANQYYEDLPGINNAIPINFPTSVSGLSGKCLSFNGFNGLDVVDDSSLYFASNESWTIETWVKTTKVGQQAFLGKRGGPSYFLVDQNSFNLARFTIQDSLGDVTSVTGSGLNDGNWHHIAAVVDRVENKLKVFVDGLESSTPKNFHSSGFFSHFPLRVGYHKNSQFFDGSLDEIAIYNRRMQSKEIARHYISGLARKGYSDDYVLVNAKLILQGAYNLATGRMDTTLRTNSYIPKNSHPYNNSSVNYNGLERVIFYPDSIVDWVAVELRDSANPSLVVGRRAAFVKKSGLLVEIDPIKAGASEIIFPDVSPGSYYIVIRHRNHLAIMSSQTVQLSKSSTLYDFTVSQSRAYTTGPDPMVLLSGSKYAMIAGDCDGSGFIDVDDFTGVDNGRFQSGYKNADSNMNGFIDSDDFIFPENNRFKRTQVP